MKFLRYVHTFLKMSPPSHGRNWTIFAVNKIPLDLNILKLNALYRQLWIHFHQLRSKGNSNLYKAFNLRNNIEIKAKIVTQIRSIYEVCCNSLKLDIKSISCTCFNTLNTSWSKSSNPWKLLHFLKWIAHSIFCTEISIRHCYKPWYSIRRTYKVVVRNYYNLVIRFTYNIRIRLT